MLEIVEEGVETESAIRAFRVTPDPEEVHLEAEEATALLRVQVAPAEHRAWDAQVAVEDVRAADGDVNDILARTQ